MIPFFKKFVYMCVEKCLERCTPNVNSKNKKYEQ